MRPCPTVWNASSPPFRAGGGGTGTHVRLDREGRVQLENDGSIIGHGPVTLMFRRQILEIGNFAEVRTRGDKGSKPGSSISMALMPFCG